jgi:hypothetical protein
MLISGCREVGIAGENAGCTNLERECDVRHIIGIPARDCLESRGVGWHRSGSNALDQSTQIPPPIVQGSMGNAVPVREVMELSDDFLLKLRRGVRDHHSSVHDLAKV